MMEAVLNSSVVELGFLLATDNEKETDFKAIFECLSKISVQLDVVRHSPWSNFVEKCVKLLQLCICLGHKAAVDFASTTIGNDKCKDPSQCGTSTVALNVLSKICKIVNGKDACNFYHAVLLEDYPLGFHFVDLLQPHVVAYSTEFIDYTILFRFLKSTVKQSGKTLEHCESKFLAGSPGFSTSTQSMAGSIEELLQCIITLLEEESLKSCEEDIFGLFSTILEIVALERLRESLVERVTIFIVNAVEERPAKFGRHSVMSLISELLKAQRSQSCNQIADLLLTTKGREGSSNPSVLVDNILKALQVWEMAFRLKSEYIETKTSLASLGLRILKHFAKCHFEKFKIVSIRCFSAILNYVSIIEEFQEYMICSSSQCSKQFLPDRPEIIFKSGLMDIYKEYLGFVEAQIFAFSAWITEEGGSKVDIATLIGLLKFNSRTGSQDNEDALYIREFLELFNKFLALTPMLMNIPYSPIPQAVMDGYAAIGSTLFYLLSDPARVHIIVSVLGFSRDHDKDVRQRAARCLALYLDFQELVGANETFLMDCLELIEAGATDKKHFITFAWAFGNLTAVLAQHYPNQLLPDSDSDMILKRLLKIVDVCFYNPKTWYNAYRSIGNILLWTPPYYYSDKEFPDILLKLIERLLKQIGHGSDFKARWNACFAVGNVLKNERLITAFGHLFVERVLEILAKCATKSQSYKERIHCIACLYKLRERAMYGNAFIRLWGPIFQWVKEPGGANHRRRTEKTDMHITEIMYRSAHCLSHFTSLMVENDLHDLDDIICRSSDIFEDVMKFSDNGNSNKEVTFEMACQNIRRLGEVRSLQKLGSLRLLKSLFAN